MTHQFCFMSSKFFFRSLDLVFFPWVQVRNNKELRLWLLLLFLFLFLSFECIFIYLFFKFIIIYLCIFFLPPFEQTSECETHQEATLKKKTNRKTYLCKDVWVEECWFFLRSGFVYPQSPNLTLFSFKNKWLKLDPLEIPCIVQGRCISVIPHTWWTKWTEWCRPEMLIHVLLPK